MNVEDYRPYPSAKLGDGCRSVPQPLSMTLRDHFAGLAMQGLLAAPGELGISTADLAVGAYKMADAMLAARGR